MPVTCHETFTCGLFVLIVKRFCLISLEIIACANCPTPVPLMASPITPSLLPLLTTLSVALDDGLAAPMLTLPSALIRIRSVIVPPVLAVRKISAALLCAPLSR